VSSEIDIGSITFWQFIVIILSAAVVFALILGAFVLSWVRREREATQKLICEIKQETQEQVRTPEASAKARGDERI